MPVAQFAGKDLREANIRAAEARLTVSQIAAMQVLGRQLALVTGAVTRNTAALMARQQGAGLRGGGLAAPAGLPRGLPRAAPRSPLAALQGLAGGGGNPAAMVGTMVAVVGAMIASKIASTIAGVLSSAISSEASGYAVFNAAMKLLANTIGMFLLPVFLLLSAIALVAADALAKHIDEVEAFAKALFEAGLYAADVLEAAANYLVKVIDGMADGFKQAVSAVDGFVKATIEAIRKLPGGSLILSALPALAVGPTAGAGAAASGAAGGFFTPRIAGSMEGELKNLELRRKLGQARGEKDTSLRQQLLDALKTSLAEFRFQSMPKAQAFGLAQASREAQLRALNQSPFEAKQLELMTKLVEAMGKVVAALGQNRQPPTTS